MNTKYCRILTRFFFLITLLGYSLSANALGVGSLSVQSKLNQKLNAHIELLSTEGVDQSQIKATLAKASIFERAGVDYSPALNDITLKVATQENGTPYIEMSSQKPLQEPVVDFILEVKWQQQRLLRKFTIMLDPAPIAKKPETPAPTVEKTVVAQNKTKIEAPQQQTTPAAPQKPQTTQSVANTSIKTYKVKTNKDTLWSIATKFRPNKSYSMDLIMAEILKQNPSAFLNNNINLLKTGSTLRFDPSLLPGQTTKKQTRSVVKKEVAHKATPKPAHNQPSSPDAEIKTHKVKSKETLWSIASKLRPDSTYSMKQIMNALLAQNPTAFHNNDISQLKKGSILHLNIAMLSGASPTKPVQTQALTTPVVQSTKHVQVTPLPAPTVKKPEPIPHVQEDLNKVQAMSQTAASLLQTIDKIQQQIIEMQNLLRDKQSELAQLKKEAQIHLATETTPVVASAPIETTSVVASAPTPTKPVITSELLTKQAPIDRSQQMVTEQLDTVKSDIQTNISNTQSSIKSTAQNTTETLSSPPVNVTEHPSGQEEGFLSRLMNDPKALVIGLGGTALLGLAGLFLYRRSKNNDEDFDIDNDNLEDTTVTIDPDQTSTFEQQLQQSQKWETDKQKPEIATDMESGEGVQLDSDLRALYEADIYIACQRYSRAEESLTSAIELNPERTEIKLKLLEVYFATQDREKFISGAEIIHKKIGEHDPKWQDVVDMGKQLCPDYPLFGGEIDSGEPPLPEESIFSNESTAQNEDHQEDSALKLDSEELQDDELSLNLEQSDDIFKTDHDSSIDLDESDLFAGQTNKAEEPETDLSSILMEEIDNNEEKPKKDKSLNLGPDDDDLAFGKA